MDSASVIQIIIVILLILGSAFFSSAETALVSVNKIQIQLLAEDGDKNAARVLWILEHSSKMLSAILIGNNLVNISASALVTTLTIRLVGNSAVGIATGILTLLVLLFGEIIPKSLATLFSQQLSLYYSGIVKFFMIVLTPLILITDGARFIVLRILHVDPNAKSSTMTEDELKSLVDVAMEDDAIEKDEFDMITNVFSLDESLAKDIMVPRIDMTFVNVDSTWDELMDIYRKDKFTRYPVYSENRDTVIGIINMKDLLLKLDHPTDDFSIRNILREPHFTFEHKEIGTLLLEMREKSINLMIVLDEYGSTSGMITLEDILEEIVGEIRDEYDKDETDAIKAMPNPGEYVIDGGTNLDDVNEMLDIHLVSEEYDSIGGFMIEYLDRLPKKGECITLDDGMKIIAEVIRRNRIETVHIILPGSKENKS